MINVLDHAFEYPLELEEQATAPFAGGIMQHGYQCGMIWGATLAAGAEAYRRHGTGPKAEAATIAAAQRLVETFRSRHEEIDCVEITDLDKSSSTWKMIHFFLIKGGAVDCVRMAGWFAPLAFDAINVSLANDRTNALAPPTPPTSCAAMLAREHGASARHVVMASGFAGGIGLCGGACGALGAAIWILGMEIGKEEGGKVGDKDPRIQQVIDRFMKHADFRFECSDIVGRRFKDVDDHARYLRDGGCSELIKVLATALVTTPGLAPSRCFKET